MRKINTPNKKRKELVKPTAEGVMKRQELHPRKLRIRGYMRRLMRPNKKEKTIRRTPIMKSFSCKLHHLGKKIIS
ncbi:MAG: hypothetical protein GF334_10655 [Candidatus Altiarchaeales archaeon]|nr:hypothetical protein [Candidatus Altiarchaeales archaeon]